MTSLHHPLGCGCFGCVPPLVARERFLFMAWCREFSNMTYGNTAWKEIRAMSKLSYRRDGERYIVMLGDDRAGFVRRQDDGKWNAADTFMAKQRNFPTRSKAGAWLAKELESAIARGDA